MAEIDDETVVDDLSWFLRPAEWQELQGCEHIEAESAYPYVIAIRDPVPIGQVYHWKLFKCGDAFDAAKTLTNVVFLELKFYICGKEYQITPPTFKGTDVYYHDLKDLFSLRDEIERKTELHDALYEEHLTVRDF